MPDCNCHICQLCIHFPVFKNCHERSIWLVFLKISRSSQIWPCFSASPLNAVTSHIFYAHSPLAIFSAKSRSISLPSHFCRGICHCITEQCDEGASRASKWVGCVITHPACLWPGEGGGVNSLQLALVPLWHVTMSVNISRWASRHFNSDHTDSSFPLTSLTCTPCKA